MHHPEAITASLIRKAGGDRVIFLEANTEGSIADTTDEILWHRRETSRQTEKTNIVLR
jgi:hypothetical protein